MPMATVAETLCQLMWSERVGAAAVPRGCVWFIVTMVIVHEETARSESINHTMRTRDAKEGKGGRGQMDI